MRWLVRNWHLKLAAVALATTLYTGLVFSGSFSEQTFSGVPITTIGQPDGTYLLSQQLGAVDVRYRLDAKLPVHVTADSFAVTVDLASYDMTRSPQPQAIPVQVRALGDGLTFLSVAPTTIKVAIDRLVERTVPVVIDRGDIPAGLEIGTPTLSDRQVVASGPQSLVQRIDRAVARVRIDESGIDVSSDVELIPVDVDGQIVSSVDLSPSTVRVSISVRTVETSKTVPIRPIVSGTPATGYEVASVTVDPPVVTLHGAPADLFGVSEVLTEPISLTGAKAKLSGEVVLIIPAGTHLPVEGSPASVYTVEVREAIGTRTIVVGVSCTGVAAGNACLPQLSQVSVTLQGTLNALNAIDPAKLVVLLDVAGLTPGSHVVATSLVLPPRISLVGISPSSVSVLIVQPATPAP